MLVHACSGEGSLKLKGGASYAQSCLVVLYIIPETQFHIFQGCEPIKAKLGISTYPKLKDIYKSSSHKKTAMLVFTKINLMRKQLIDNIIPIPNIKFYNGL